MKKITLFASALLFCSSAVQLQAQSVDYSTNTSTDLFDFTPWDNEALLKLFAEAYDEGRVYPTEAEFEAAGFGLDLEFSRSHVRPAVIMEDAAKNLISNEEGVYPTRRLWMNLPTGQGKSIGGYPSAEFHSDVYSMWNYTHIFGAWNHGILQAPGAWADAAHKNGSLMYSGIKFFEHWTPGGTSSEWVNLITAKNDDGTYRYVDALLNALRYMGLDGINYNFEDDGYMNADVVGFHRALHKRAEEIGFDSFHIGIYTTDQTLTTDYAYYNYGDKNGKVADLMLNYNGGGGFSWGIEQSVNAAIESMGTADGLYAGVWIVYLSGRGWERLNSNETVKQCGITCWGEHDISRLFQFTIGNTLPELQSNYQMMLERFFSGGYENPANRPTDFTGHYVYDPSNETSKITAEQQLNNFPGMASFIPERTAIQGKLPFNTHFSLGNGDFYAYKGKKTLGSWYNMGQQDYVPTYRWLLYQANTKNVSTNLDVAFTHSDAYIGGSALQLTSSSTNTGTDVILYRTKLDVSAANAKATVALKSGKEGTTPANLSVILKKLDNDTWYEYPLGNVEGKTWQEQEVALSDFVQGDVIEYIGFRVKGGVSNYNMLVGQLKLSDDRAAVYPAGIDASSLLAEVKAETHNTMSVKFSWEVDAAGFSPALADWNMIYNDEVNIDHFEIFYKNGENGRVSEVGRTSTWSAFVGNIQFADDSDQPYIGVRAVSVDMKTYSPIAWIAINRDLSIAKPVEEDPYPKTYLNTASEGYKIAQTNRFIAKFQTSGATQNLNYTNNTPVGGDNYVYATDHVLKVEQGQRVTVFMQDAYYSDGLIYTMAKGYADWDLNRQFSTDNDEIIAELGEEKVGIDSDRNAFHYGINFTFTVPEDAAVGSSRLRMVFSDAWFTHPGPTGGTAKGFSIDFPMEVTGNNPSRGDNTVDTRDPGVADEPNDLEGTGIDSVTDNAVSSFYPSVAEDVIYFNNVDKAWIYSVGGGFVKFVTAAPASANVSDLAPGIYIVKMQQGNVIRSQKLIKK